MDKNQKYSCINDVGAEVLMVITSSIITITTLMSVPRPDGENRISKKVSDFVLSSVYALFLPIMSYLFSQAKQNSPEGRSQLILIWMVLVEFIQVHAGGPMWEIRKSGEQLLRLLWVAYLVWDYTTPDGLRTSLLVLCAFSFTYEVLKGVYFHKAKNSYLIGNNPKLIHNYMKRVMLEDDLKTTPMNSCAYIVMGEENHQIAICENGYLLGDKKPNSKGMLTIGRVFQNSSEDEAFTLAKPNWRNFCLSLALAKMLRRRFANLPLDEAGSSKALAFVLEGLINYIGSNKYTQVVGSNEKRNPVERVFCIIRDELKFISDFLHTEVPAYIYFDCYKRVRMTSVSFMAGAGIYLIYTMFRRRSKWLSLVTQDEYNGCFFHNFRRGAVVAKVFVSLDIAITILLVVACIYIPYRGFPVVENMLSRWFDLRTVKEYIENPAKWNKYGNTVAASKSSTLRVQHENKIRNKVKKIKQGRIHYSIFDAKVINTIFCIKWITRNFSREFTIVSHSTAVKEAILMSLRKSGGQLTNGKTALTSHRILEHLDRLYQPSGSSTETILIWHIATTLFYQREPPPQPNNDPFKKERDVALSLSSYCHYLVASLPQLLPDEVEWTEDMYKRVRKEIFAIDNFSGQKPTRMNRCNYIMDGGVIREENYVVGKGAKLAMKLVDYAENGTQVWTMLSEFWAELMLFITPSDNVKGHEEILEKNELITQLWALLTHAGILTRPVHKPPNPNPNHERIELTDVVIATQHPNHESGSNEITEVVNCDGHPASPNH